MKNMKIMVEINDEVLEGVLDSASRGASYWADASELAYESEVKKVMNGKESVEIVNNDAEKGEKKTYVLNLAILKKGLELMSEKAPEAFSDILADNYDNGTGDVLLQCCLLKDIVYS